MEKEEKIVLIWFLFFTLLFFILALALRIRVSEDKTYEDRDHIALYIYKYNHLPSNYIKKDENPCATRSEAVLKGYSFGGDVFENREGLISNPNNYVLREADYYLTRSDGRGSYRLVYTIDGDMVIKYTEDHYETYSELSRFSINVKSSVMWIVFAVTCCGDIMVIAIIRIKKEEE